MILLEACFLFHSPNRIFSGFILSSPKSGLIFHSDQFGIFFVDVAYVISSEVVWGKVECSVHWMVKILH